MRRELGDFEMPIRWVVKGKHLLALHRGVSW